MLVPCIVGQVFLVFSDRLADLGPMVDSERCPFVHTTEPIDGPGADAFLGPALDLDLPEPGPRVLDQEIAAAVGKRFDELQEAEPHPRGPEFEELLRILFLLNGFEVERNSAIAA